MKIQINTDKNIEDRGRLAQYAEDVVENTLGRFAERITRVEIHLGDENSEKGGNHDKRCTMEARLKGRQPMAVRHTAETFDQAVGGAADKLKHSLDHTLGRLQHKVI